MSTIRKKHSLFKKIIIPLIGVMIFQSLFFFCATFFGGVSTTINQNAQDVLTERVINQEHTVETKFSNQWTNMSMTKNAIYKVYKNVAANNYQKVYEDETLQKKVLSQTSDVLINMIRSNEVTGAFLIMNNSKEYRKRQTGDNQEHYGVCIRDYSPTSAYEKNEDLLVVRCPSSMMKTVGCAMETWWAAKFVFSDDVPGDYFYKPLKMAYDNPGSDSMDLAYFDGVHNYGQADRPVVSYSIPLMDETGYPYAVLGVELTTDYLKTLIPASTLYAENTSCYALVQYTEGGNEFNVVAVNGVLYQQCFGDKLQIKGDVDQDNILTNIDTISNIKLTGSLSNLQIYNRNTPYEKERFALIGMVKNDELYGINVTVRRSLIIVSIIVLVVGCILAFFISRQLTRPINKLSKKVRTMKGETKLELERLNIDEIDDLVESIEGLSDTVNRNAIRTEFFSRMSHDMRTPMNAIIGFSSPELLANADLKTMQEYMEKVHLSGNFLLTLINEVLDMAKIEMQRMELREEPITRDQVLSSIIPIIQEVAKEHKVQLVIDIDDSKVVFLGDSQRVSQIIMNLLSNAVKFTPEGGTVRLEVKECERDNEKVHNRIVIQDSGCGMSEEFQKKMYEPFSQADTVNGGTGLGLAIAHQMTMLMGGTLTCESKLGEGTTFTIDITHRIVAMQPEKTMEKSAQIGIEPKKKEVQSEPSLQGKKVLLCEDHPLNIQIATKLLERMGIVVETATDGEAGLKMFKESDPDYYDLILMDIRMPKMTGLECSEAIRGLTREDAHTVPIVAMTANAFKEDVEASKNAGMNEHLSKPIDPKILRVTLEKYLTAQ